MISKPRSRRAARMHILLPSARVAAIRINGQSVGKELMLGPLIAGLLNFCQVARTVSADS